jgi:hypothetical protein
MNNKKAGLIFIVHTFFTPQVMTVRDYVII